MATTSQLIGTSDAISDIKQKLPVVSACDATVLITGETGTGKEVLAKTIHEQSNRSGGPFVPINCGALPRELVENELFGHRKGAYSQAFDNQKGLVDVASEGTLFLDEIDSLPLEIQPKLLRLLQEREYRPVGDNRLKKVDLRFIAAALTNLADRVRDRTFRADLYYRLTIFHMHLPPLRDRKDDIPSLAAYFVGRFGQAYGKGKLTISEEALAHLTSYNWPGNIRELEHAVHRAAVWCQTGELRPEHFDLPTFEDKSEPQDWNQPYHDLKEQILVSFEQEYICKILKLHEGNVSAAARSARLDRRTFQRLMAKHDINHDI
ncbi:MAG: sigma-54 interaction domain-containing protein [Planctomycetota bacterium]|jgi:transcriptional regulator with GAF, ATPase, and Fis domain